MEIEGYSFQEAALKLAEKANIDLEIDMRLRMEGINQFQQIFSK